MKKTYLYIAAILAIALGFVACKSTIPEVEGRGTLSISSQEIVIENDGGVRSIEVNASDGDWELVPSFPDWIEATILDDVINLEIKPNKESQERDAELTIYAPKSKLTKVVSVRQFGVSPALYLDQERVVFDRNGGELSVSITVNGSDWTVSDPHNVPWLTVEQDPVGKTLKLTALPVDKEARDSGATRSTILVLSYGTSHSMLTVRQDGWQYYPNILLKMDAKKDDVIAFEQKEGHVRDTEYESKYQSGDVLVFKTEALEGTRVLYRYNNGELEAIEIKADENKAFTEEHLKEWFTSKGYVFSTAGGEEHYNGGVENFYYADDGEFTSLATVVNGERSRNKSIDTPGAFMTFARYSNQAVPNAYRNAWLNFPVRNVSWICNPKYTVDDIIKYEEEHGMIFAPHNGNTKPNNTGTYPEVKYKSIAFLPKDEAGIQYGDLKLVVYFFNIPGLMDDTGRPKEFNSNNPDLAGSISQRYDAYEGEEFLIRAMGSYLLKPFVSQNTKRYGYKPATFIQDFGYFYFTRGNDEDLMYIQVLGGANGVSFGKDKNLVESFLKDNENN